MDSAFGFPRFATVFGDRGLQDRAQDDYQYRRTQPTTLCGSIACIAVQTHVVSEVLCQIVFV